MLNPQSTSTQYKLSYNINPIKLGMIPSSRETFKLPLKLPKLGYTLYRNRHKIVIKTPSIHTRKLKPIEEQSTIDANFVYHS